MARPIKKRLPKLSIFDAALEFGVDRNFLTKELKRTYASGRERFTVEEVYRALNSDSAKETARAKKARADMLVLEYEEAAGKMVPIDDFREGVESFVEVANNEIASLEAPEDSKRTLLRQIAGIKKNCLGSLSLLNGYSPVSSGSN
jgi:hypothetical protein